jgi:serine/threonine protein kinase
MHKFYSQGADMIKKMGHYQIEGLLGEGTMAKVYIGRHQITGLRVAIKALSTDDKRHHARFQREARLLAQLNHPNIIRVYEVTISKGRLFYTMEILDNLLTNFLNPPPFTKNNDFLDISLFHKLEILTDILAGLTYLHSKGVIHRDLCPNNVLIDKHYKACISDLGMSKLEGDLTLPDSSRGNPKLYGAPEQDQSLEKASSATDIYSFAVIAYQLISGFIPKGRSITDLHLLNKKLALPEEISLLISQSLENDPQKRPNAENLLQTFSKYLKNSHETHIYEDFLRIQSYAIA